MKFQYNDGGREAAGFKGKTGDCVTRSIVIATGLPYKKVYDDLWEKLREFSSSHRSRYAKKISNGGGKRGTTPRNGVGREIYHPYLLSLGWKWQPTMKVGQGCRVHLRQDELPKGNIIVRVSKHITAVIDGVIHDTFDPSRDGTRCVYGYYSYKIIESNKQINMKKTKTLRFDNDILEKLEYLAKLDKRSLNNLLEVILEKYLQDNDDLLKNFDH